MPFIALELAKTISEDESDLTNLLIHITSSTDTILTYLEVETASIILAKIFKKIYNDIPYYILLEECFTKKFITVSSKKIYIADKELFSVILLNSIRKSDDFSKTKSFEIPECIITNILTSLNVEKKYTGLLLRTLNRVILKRKYLSPLLCEKIILEMQKVALSPLTGFKRCAYGVSQTVLSFLDDKTQKGLCKIDFLPVKGIDTMDLVTLYPAEFIKSNKILIVKKVCFLFKNNLENKDREALYRRLISIYSFQEWKEEIWPILLPFLQKVNKSGEFFQSLLKYWITSNVKEYKAAFYPFLETQPIDNIFKVSTALETCRNGFISEHIIIKEHFYDIRNVHFKLRIISTYYKKTLVPGQKEKEIFLEILYSNINYFLDMEVIKYVEMFISQLFIYAHNDLKKTTKQLEIYSDFLYQIYKFCYGIICTELYEVGVQVLQILLDLSKGGHKHLHLAYKLEKMDFYEEGENLLYNKLKDENKWNFEGDEMISRIQLCLEKNQGCSSLLINLIRSHYPITYFVNIESFRDILKYVEDEMTLQTYNKISNLSLLLFKIKDVDDLQEYVDVLTEELMFLIDIETVHFNNNSHKATLRIIALVNAYEHSFLVKDYGLVICKCLATFKELLISSANCSEFGYVKILESFVNNVICGLHKHLDLVWDNTDKEFIVRSVIAILEKSNMRRPIMLNEALLKKLSQKMEMQEEDRLLKIKIVEQTLDKLFRMKEYKDYKIRRNPESRLVLHALCSYEKCPEKPLLRWVLRFLLEILNDNVSSEESITAAYHCLEIFISDKNLHESTLEFIPEIIQNSVEGFTNLNWGVRNANLQLTKALIERIYGVSLGLWNRPKDISDLFQLYPQLSGYFFKILTSESLDERAHIVFQYFLESQLGDKIFSKTFIKISAYFQQLFINIIKDYEHHYGKLAAHSFVALCRVHDIPTMICDIKEFIEINAINIRKNILSNLILLLQELYYKFRKSFQGTNTKKIMEIQNYLQELSRFLKLSDLPYFYPIFFDVTSIQNNLNKIKSLNCGNCQQDRRWLHNNLHFIILHSKPSDVVNVCDVLFLQNLPVFAQIKILSILIYRYEKQNFELNDIKHILELLFRSTVMVEDKQMFLLQSLLRVILVFGGNLLELDIKINSRTELAFSDSLCRNTIFLLNKFFSKTPENENLSVHIKTIEHQLIQSLDVTEETDHDIMSVLIYFYKMSDSKNMLNFFKLVFYFCTNESTYLGAYYLISYIMAKKYCSILLLLKDFFHYDHLRLVLTHSDIVNLYKGLNLFLKNDSVIYKNRNSFYEIEGDDLISSDTLKLLLRYLKSQMYLINNP